MQWQLRSEGPPRRYHRDPPRHGHGDVEEHITVAISEAERIRGADLGLRLGTTISGRVFDAETGLPLANIHIRADNVFGNIRLPAKIPMLTADISYKHIAREPTGSRLKESAKAIYVTFYDGDLVVRQSLK